MRRLIKTGSMAAGAWAIMSFAGRATAVAEMVASDAAPGSELTEVVVTARRRTENLQSTPISVTAFTGQDLAAQEVLNISDVARSTPNLSSNPTIGSKNAPTLQLRGQVQNDQLITLDPSVGVYVNDIYMARAYSVLTDLLDVQDVEVLKGPQGTLYGRNTTGGAIKVETVKPSLTDGIAGFLTVGGGNYKAFNASGAITLPVIPDMLAIRYAGSYETHDGYTNSYLVNQPNLTPVARIDTDNLNNYTHRLTVLFQPIESLTMELVGAYFQAVDNNSLVVNKGGDVTNIIAPPPNFAFGYSNSPQRQANFYSALTPIVPYSSGRDSSVMLNTRYDINSNLWSKLILGYVKSNNRSYSDGSGIASGSVALVEFYPDLNESQHQESAEWQVGGQAFEDKLTFIGGLYYFTEKGAELSPATTYVFGFPDGVAFQGDAENSSKSAYGDVDWKWTDRFDTTLGLRYTIDSKGLDGFNRDDTGVCIYPAGPGIVTSATPGGACELNRTDKFDYTTWEVGANYRFTDDLYGYAKAGDGYRSGGQQLRAVNAASSAPFSPEKVVNYELGLKSEFLDHIARVNAAYFHSNYSQIQQTEILSPPLYPTTTTIVVNNGDAKVDGFEVEGLLRPVTGLTLSASTGYTNFRFADPTKQQTSVSKFTGAAGVAYTQPVSIGDLTGRLDYNFRGKFVVGPDRDVDTQLPASSLLNARLSLLLRQGLEVALYGKNLTQEHYYLNGVSSGILLPVYLGAPRTYGAEATYRFGK